MSKQTEAQRLADAICDYSRFGFETEEVAKARRHKSHEEAAAELRRLSAANAELLEALKEIIELHGQWTNGIWAANKARAAIAKHGRKP